LGGRAETRKQALLVDQLVIGTLSGVFALVGFIVEAALDIPSRLQLPPVVRGAGMGILALGFAFMGWLFRYRSPVQILTSTFETMQRSVKKSRTERTLARSEALVVEGPHRHVRHPLYFAVLVLFVGCWLLLDYTVLLTMSILFLLWFSMVVIRFEEQELRALFGDEYASYAKAVPMLIPSLWARWPRRGRSQE
jgi:protein-S-isoprenylcysteine O-methyltransferase Ste14